MITKFDCSQITVGGTYLNRDDCVVKNVSFSSTFSFTSENKNLTWRNFLKSHLNESINQLWLYGNLYLIDLLSTESARILLCIENLHLMRSNCVNDR